MTKICQNGNQEMFDTLEKHMHHFLCESERANVNAKSDRNKQCN